MLGRGAEGRFGSRSRFLEARELGQILLVGRDRRGELLLDERKPRFVLLMSFDEMADPAEEQQQGQAGERDAGEPEMRQQEGEGDHAASAFRAFRCDQPT